MLLGGGKKYTRPNAGHTHSTKEIHMSDKTETTVTAVPTAVDLDVAVTKPSFWQSKVVAPIKSHPKIATAVAAGVALVAGSAFLGRKSAEYDVVLELQPTDNDPVDPITVIDTSSSDE